MTRETGSALAIALAGAIAGAGFLVGIVGCGAPAACAPSSELARIEAAYVAEMVVACRGYAFDACPARPAVETKYATQREAWARCSK